MNDWNHYQALEFTVEGQFVGFVGTGSLKYLRLRMPSEEMQIKIPKPLRLSVALALQPNDPIRVIGIGKLNPHTQQLKLKATQIDPLTVHWQPTLATTSSIPTLPVTPPAHSKPKLKVLICQKSGCLKKGGRGLYSELAKGIRDRELEQYVTIERTGCLKRCSSPPNLVLMPDRKTYSGVNLPLLTQVLDAIAKRLVVLPK